jgi:hypothetical protein
MNNRPGIDMGTHHIKEKTKSIPPPSPPLGAENPIKKIIILARSINEPPISGCHQANNSKSAVIIIGTMVRLSKSKFFSVTKRRANTYTDNKILGINRGQ